MILFFLFVLNVDVFAARFFVCCVLVLVGLLTSFSLIPVRFMGVCVCCSEASGTAVQTVWIQPGFAAQSASREQTHSSSSVNMFPSDALPQENNTLIYVHVASASD